MISIVDRVPGMLKLFLPLIITLFDSKTLSQPALWTDPLAHPRATMSKWVVQRGLQTPSGQQDINTWSWFDIVFNLLGSSMSMTLQQKVNRFTTSWKVVDIPSEAPITRAIDAPKLVESFPFRIMFSLTMSGNFPFSPGPTGLQENPILFQVGPK